MSQLRGKCPGCPNEFVYDEGTTSVYCEFCQEWKPVATLKPIGGSSKADKGHTGAVPAAAMQGFDNPESGIVFMENFFDTMDWTDYKESPKLEMADLQECLENNKIKNGAIGATWYMEFKGLSVPLSKKLEGLKEKEQEMADEYDPVDSTKAYAAFNIYRKVSDAIIAKRDNLITRMEKAIEYATKYNLDAAHVAEINVEFEAVKAGLEAVTEVKVISEIPSFVRAKAAIDEVKAAELAEKGINAQDDYDNGVAQYNSTNPNKAPALAKLEKVRGYSDSEEYIAKINKYYSLDDLRYFFGKYFVYKLESVGATFNVGKAGCFGKNKKQPENPEEEVKAWSLYEVVNGVPEDKPVLKGIDSLVMNKDGEVACYNNKIFYIKNGQGLYSYDVYTGEEKLLDKGKEGDYCRNKEGYLEFAFSENNRCFVLKRKLRDEPKKGCTGKRKTKTEEEIRLNNYSLLFIDMFTNDAKTIVDEMVDIIGKFGNKVFYSYAHREINTKVKKQGCSKVKEKEVKYLKDLMVVDLAGGAPKQVLDQACEIKAVCENKAIYWKWHPNKLNKDLYVYNLATGENTLVEDNVYSLDGRFPYIKDRLYYKVGNKNYCTLISNNFEGTDRKEVMQEVSNINIIGERAGWLYIVVGGGKNRLLVKVHTDNTETRYPVCPQFSSIIDITSTHIYYQDTSNNLRVVCADGTDNKILAKGVSDFVDGEDCLYYVRVETIAEGAANGLFGGSAAQEGVSLYKMDKEGHNIRKLVFGVDKVREYDEKALYYTKAEEMRFKVTMPIVNKETGEKEWHYEYHSVQRFFRFDKASEKSTLVLTMGLPSAKMESEKKGCFGKKKVEEDIIYEADPEIIEYEPQGLAPMGLTDIEHEVEAAANAPQGVQALTQNLPAGCTGKKADANNSASAAPANKNNGCGCTGKKK